jgi:hypothetical protein
MTAARQRQGSKVAIPSTGYGTGTQLDMLQSAGGGIAAPPPGPPPVNPRIRDAQTAPLGPLPSAFGPTQRPGEPITAGVPFGPGLSPPPVDPAEETLLMLQAMYRVLPHPGIQRLMMSGRG